MYTPIFAGIIMILVAVLGINVSRLRGSKESDSTNKGRIFSYERNERMATWSSTPR